MGRIGARQKKRHLNGAIFFHINLDLLARKRNFGFIGATIGTKIEFP